MEYLARSNFAGMMEDSVKSDLAETVRFDCLAGCFSSSSKNQEDRTFPFFSLIKVFLISIDTEKGDNTVM